MRDATVCLLVRGDPPQQILLGLKKAGFAAGKYNGIGGKVEDGETVIAAAVRELEEEIRVRATEDDLQKVGHFTFLFRTKPEWNQVVHVYLVRTWRGIPEETAEMAPTWFDLEEIPYQHMWQDDSHWLPRVLAGERIRARYIYGADHESIERIKVEPWETTTDGESIELIGREQFD